MTKNFLQITTLAFVTILLIACIGDKGKVTHGVVNADFIYISSEEPGLIKEMLVQRGDKVNKDEVIALLENKQIEDNFEETQAELKRQKNILVDMQKPGRNVDINEMQALLAKKQASYGYQVNRYKRIKELFEKKYASKDELEQAKSLVDNAKADVDTMQSKLDRVKLGDRNDRIIAQKFLVKKLQIIVEAARSKASKLKVKSINKGVVFDVVHHEGEYVNPGETIISLLANSKLKITFYLDRESTDQIKVGDMIKASCQSCNNYFTAKINYISDESEFNPTENYDEKNSAKRVYRIEASVPDGTSNFKPGEPVKVIWKQ